jgi:hypothetical protein
MNTIQPNGVQGNPVTFEGGWNPATNLRDGDTYLDGTSGWGYCFASASKNFVNLQNFSVARYNRALSFSTSNRNNVTLNNVVAIEAGVWESTGSNNHLKATNVSSSSTLFSTNTAVVGVTYSMNRIYGCGAATLNGYQCKVNVDDYSYNLVAFGSTAPESTLRVKKFSNNGNTNGQPYTLNFTGSNTTMDWYIESSTVPESAGAFLDNARLNVGVNSNARVGVTNLTTSNGLLRSALVTDGAYAQLVGGDSGWYIRILNSTRSAVYPFDMRIARIACKAGVPVTATLQVNLLYSDARAALHLQGDQPGISGDVTSNVIATNGSWQTATLTFTPTMDTVVELDIQAWNTGATWTALYFDNLVIT